MKKIKGTTPAKATTKVAVKQSAATQSRQDLIDMALETDDNLTVKNAQRMTMEQLRIAAGIKPTQPTATPEAKPKVTSIDSKPKSDKGKDCGCGCGGRTKGGRYLPGHDAKHHTQLHPSKYAPKACGCGCLGTNGQPAMTKGGRFLPGHDAKFYSMQLKAEATETKKSHKKAS